MRNVLFIVLCLIILSACTQNNADSQNENKNSNNNVPNSEFMPKGVSVRDSHLNTDTTKASDEERAQHLANLAASVPNVNDATAVVLGNIAVVGIDIDGNVERSQVGTIKYSVAESLKHDPHGAGAVVVADPDINARLKEISEDIKNGKPIQGLMNELADIVGRVIPDIPIQEKGKNPEDSMDNQKQDLNNTKENKLEKEQEEHSSGNNI
ncbi:YhcN/YlaJ family sporulation lipoprotein [Lederbergia graminis]|uniref:YhcN/YlaJ family sporulation lipoprotein n=1 Tax=Lederbergia graminis TaxID=735518 RepID=A0ABW0LGJ5_9BACI|nr:YhcN/YlaJ family sporulation lipoprotein [Paenibacillus bovis]HLU23389.1 YhcN/YlaJ family sporulation lipoprotein [Bacillaceae bacterium]